MATLNNHIFASNEALANWCSRPDCKDLGGSPYGNKVVRISDKAVKIDLAHCEEI